jgi:hypothetical protein
MKKDEFTIGLEFYTAAGKWRCTDVGTRVIIAIRIDQVTVERTDDENRKTTKIVTDDPSWFEGPPYAVAECVFDKFDMDGCSIYREAFTEIEIGTLREESTSNA